MSEVTSELRAKFSLLNFIEQTAQFTKETELIRSWLGKKFDPTGKHEELRQQSYQSINTMLWQLGGFPATIDANGDMPQLTAKLLEWQGINPDDSSQHMWLGTIANRRIAVVLAQEAIQEIREQLVAEINV